MNRELYEEKLDNVRTSLMDLVKVMEDDPSAKEEDYLPVFDRFVKDLRRINRPLD